MGATPVPDIVTVAGEFVALLTKEMDPEIAPEVEGVKVTVTDFVELAATLNGKVRPTAVKSDPVTFAAETETAELPVFDSVIVRLELLPRFTLPNASEVGEALIR